MSHSANDSVESVARKLLASRDLELVSYTVIQSLWAGYGHICRLNAKDKKTGNSVNLILKHIDPPAQVNNGKNPDEGHIRKILSYQIEQYFYTHLAPQMPPEIAVATCIASMSSGPESNATAMIMTDLREQYPLAGEKRTELSEVQTYAALEWLADFHAFWWKNGDLIDRGKLCKPPLEHYKEYGRAVLSDGGVWLNGGYTYLATRQQEYSNLARDTSSEWSSTLTHGHPSPAESASHALSPENPDVQAYITLIHGDVKSENLFSTKDGRAVAFYDFQYVGLGLGVCDLAKLFTCSVPMGILPAAKGMGEREEGLLRRYYDRLVEGSGRKYPWEVFVGHWEMALVDWLRFQASWGFWGNTEWLEERVRGILASRA